MAKKQTTAEMFALRALYRETAALLEMMAERFDKVASGATLAAQLRDLAGDVQVECSIREHPTSSVWATAQWREFGLAAFEHMLVSSPYLCPPDGDLVETTLLRFRSRTTTHFGPSS